MKKLAHDMSRCTPSIKCGKTGSCLRYRASDSQRSPYTDFSLDIHPGKPCWMYIKSETES